MEQISDEQIRNGLQRETIQRINELRTEMDARLQILELPVFESSNYGSSPNYLPNSSIEWSTLAYTTAGTTSATAGDTNQVAYNFYQQAATATDLSASTGLLASGHSGYAGLSADAPTWNRVNTGCLIGSSATNYDACAPLPTDFVFPGQTYYVYFEASLAGANNINDAQFYAGFWDNTAGQRKWIEGSDFTPTISVYGSTGSRTIEYKIHARTDSGAEMLSVAVSVANAPATLSADNHIRLAFTGAPGFIEYNIYRKVGANYYKVGEIRNSIDLQFYDLQETGSSVVSVGGYPSVSGNRPKAYSMTSTFEPGSTGTFTAHTMAIQVPVAYNRSNTGNLQQYFRFGLSGLVAGTSDRRSVAIRRISVSEGYGAWTRSPRDMQAASGPSGSATSAPAPGTPTDTPPGTGGGGPVCLTLDTLIETPEGEVPIADIHKRDVVVFNGPSRVKGIKKGVVQFVWEIETENGFKVRCSDTHKWIQSENDRYGKSAAYLKVGDELLTKKGISKVTRKEKLLGQFEVKSISLPDPHRYWANGIASHNQKEHPEDIPL